VESIEKYSKFSTALSKFDNDKAIVCVKDKRRGVVQGLPKMMKFMPKKKNNNMNMNMTAHATSEEPQSMRDEEREHTHTRKGGSLILIYTPHRFALV